MVNNAADRKSIREAEKRAAVAERDRGEVIISIMSTTNGRAWIWDRLEVAHIFTPSFSADPVQMAFREGERNSGLLLLGDIMKWCPDQFIQAMREANGRRTESDIRNSINAPAPAADEHAGSEEPGRLDEGPTVDDASGEVSYPQ